MFFGPSGGAYQRDGSVIAGPPKFGPARGLLRAGSLGGLHRNVMLMPTDPKNTLEGLRPRSDTLLANRHGNQNPRFLGERKRGFVKRFAARR